MNNTQHPDKMQKIISLCKRRGFIYPGSQIYGGLANSWDFGPLGAQLKKNIKDLWWQHFIIKREDILPLDAAILMNKKVWKASGHLAGFNDLLVDCKKCQARIRADHLIEQELQKKAGGMSQEKIGQIIKDNNLKCPECGSLDLTKPRQFNLMFKTFMGTTTDQESVIYLRPETAQAMFVNFKNILDSNRVNLPFGIAQIGRSFRNEITPGNFIFRVLEFEQMEIEYFVKQNDWEQYFLEWTKAMEGWLDLIGIDKKNYTIRQHSKDELSHYSKKTIDFEYKFPFGTKELYGLAYRTDFDLIAHQKASKINLQYRDPQTNKKFIPHVLEPTFGVERTLLAVLCDAYQEISNGRDGSDKQNSEIVLRLDKKLAPIKLAVFPLIRKKKLKKRACSVADNLRCKLSHLPNFVIVYDESGSIGKRYRRQDEIGTPYCITVDFDSLDDDAVTVRDRDTMKQQRVATAELADFFKQRFI